MPGQARVTAIDVLESFRTNLILYVSRARPTLEEVNGDVLRTRLWFEGEQKSLWLREGRRRTRALEEAQAALFSARMTDLREASTAEMVAVHRARRALDEAQEKLRAIKQWERDFGNQTEPTVRQLERLHTLLSNELPKAVIYLNQIIATLRDYAETHSMPSLDVPGAPASSTGGNLPGPAPLPEGTSTPAGDATTPLEKPVTGL